MCARAASTASPGQIASPPQPIFRLGNTDAVAFLISHHKMHYLGASRAGGNGHDVQFLIDDPDGLAEQRVRDFRLGTPDPADPRALLQVHSFLRNEIQRVRSEAASVQPVR
jgi:hypothetical protein